MAYDFEPIEEKWQAYWLENRSFRALDPSEAGDMPKAYILDMFPYPSGAGLHVGHPEGYTATDITARYLRMKGVNVLHPMGWDAFGLPAEQYAVKTGVHPARTTKKNIANFRRQIRMLGLSYDWDREINTTDPKYYQWTQWIFLQLFNSYFDPIEEKARPIDELIRQLNNESLVVAPDGSVQLNKTLDGMAQISGQVGIERLWRDLSPDEQRQVIDGQRLAYMDEIPVNWCPGLGTVLANEEVIDGRSEVGGFPVERRPMRQWMLRITAYADRLLADLDLLDWPESLKEMQRNWIGRSVGAEVDFEIDPASLAGGGIQIAQGSEPQPQEDAPSEDGNGEAITVFTTRPDTLHGATYMVLAPEHPLVERLTQPTHRETVESYQKVVASRSERDRMAETKEKTGVFTGAYAVNPVSGERIPIYIADYVLMGYGTGAIMAVPAHDQRDFEFAKRLNLPLRAVVMPPEEWLKANAPDGGDGGLADLYLADPAAFKTAFGDQGTAIHSGPLDGLATPDAKARIIEQLKADGVGHPRVQYKLRDWLFSRQRYWGEPFPILLDEEGNAHALAESDLPLELPKMEDFAPTGTPEPPLSKAGDWLKVESRGQVFHRETNTMPQWAGSCWYYLRFIDPHNETQLVDPEKEKYWMPVDLYVGGVEHAVLHLLYARFWHKALFDLGHVSTIEPFQRLVNQGLILGQTEYHFFEQHGKPISVTEVRDIAEEATPGGPKLAAFRRDTGEKVWATRITEQLVEKKGTEYVLKADPSIRVDARSFKMSKSRGNVVNPDDLVQEYGADAFRLYEMYMGPLESPKPWNTRDIVGMSRFLAKVWRNLIGGDDAQGVRVIDALPSPELTRRMHRTIQAVTQNIEAMHFNTAIAALIELNNAMTGLDAIPRELAENFALMLAPFAPHLAEELWARLGHDQSLGRAPWPAFDESQLAEATITIPVQVNGKVRDKITIAADADKEEVLTTAEACEKVKPWIEGKTLKTRIYIPKKMVSLVTG